MQELELELPQGLVLRQARAPPPELEPDRVWVLVEPELPPS